MKKTGQAIPNQLLRSQRKLHCWTQSQVAEKIGTTNVNVNRWESGFTSPSLYFRQKLCELFGKSAEELGLIPKTEKHEQIAVALPSLPKLWNMPFRRNPFFTGREDVLTHLRNALEAGNVAAVAQPQAINGLGGIGKTQTVVEYAYRHSSNYQAILWVKADSRELLISDFVDLARLLDLREKDEQDKSRIVVGVKRWLKEHTGWLLILDNVEDVELASDFLPAASKGHILLTTRTQTTGSIAQRIELAKMEPEEGALFLLRRATLLAPDAPLNHASTTNWANARAIAEVLDGLPLALDQAGAYIDETECGLSGYLARYQTRRVILLGLRGDSVTDHPEPVATTWSLSFEKLNKANPIAADLLRLCAFLHPDAIPEEIITTGIPELGSMSEPTAADLLELDAAIRDLRKFSLMRRDPDTQSLMVHRLVQAVLSDEMDEQTRHQWAERTVRAVSRAFPDGEFPTWQDCQRFLPHVQVCADLIERWDLAFLEAAHLLRKAGYYLYQRAQYAEAELLSQQALTMRERLLGLEHPEVAESLGDLTWLYYKQGKYARAEQFGQRALAIREKVLGNEHPEVAESLSDLAALYEEQGKYDKAERLNQRALAIREKALGPEHAEVAESLNNLALIYHAQSKYEQAEPLYQRVLFITEKVLGPEHPATAISLNNLGRLYHAQGKYEQAEPILQRALFIKEQALGQNNPSVAVSLNNLARLYHTQGKYEQAESFFQRALAIREQELGREHSEVAQTLSDLAKLYSDQDKYVEARPLYQRALSIFDQSLGPEHPNLAPVLENYASLLRKMNRETEARALNARVLAIQINRVQENLPE